MEDLCGAPWVGAHRRKDVRASVSLRDRSRSVRTERHHCTVPCATDAQPPSRRCSTWARIVRPPPGTDRRPCSFARWTTGCGRTGSADARTTTGDPSIRASPPGRRVVEAPALMWLMLRGGRVSPGRRFDPGRLRAGNANHRGSPGVPRSCQSRCLALIARAPLLAEAGKRPGRGVSPALCPSGTARRFARSTGLSSAGREKGAVRVGRPSPPLVTPLAPRAATLCAYRSAADDPSRALTAAAALREA